MKKIFLISLLLCSTVVSAQGFGPPPNRDYHRSPPENRYQQPRNSFPSSRPMHRPSTPVWHSQPAMRPPPPPQMRRPPPPRFHEDYRTEPPRPEPRIICDFHHGYGWRCRNSYTPPHHRWQGVTFSRKYFRKNFPERLDFPAACVILFCTVSNPNRSHPYANHRLYAQRTRHSCC